MEGARRGIPHYRRGSAQPLRHPASWCSAHQPTRPPMEIAAAPISQRQNLAQAWSSIRTAPPCECAGARGCSRSVEPPYDKSTAPSRGLRWIGKPGSVVERHSSGMDVTNHLKRPTRRLGRVNPRRLRGAPAYLVLLPGGFAVPVLLPVRRWALTPPFHPCLFRLRGHRRFVLCCTFRRVAPPWCYQAQHPAEPGLSSALADSDALIHGSTVSPHHRRPLGSFRRQGHQPAFPLQILQQGPARAVGIPRGAP